MKDELTFIFIWFRLGDHESDWVRSHSKLGLTHLCKPLVGLCKAWFGNPIQLKNILRGSH